MELGDDAVAAEADGDAHDDHQRQQHGHELATVKGFALVGLGGECEPGQRTRTEC